MLGTVERIDYDGERVQKVILRFPAHTSRSKVQEMYTSQNTSNSSNYSNNLSNNSTNSLLTVSSSNLSNLSNSDSNDSAGEATDVVLEVTTCEHIGQGSFGTVYRAFCDMYPKLALKISTGKATRLRQELEVLSKVCTKGRLVLPRFEFGALNKTADLIVIGMELCVPLTLHDLLLQTPLQDESDMLFLAHQVVQAISYVHAEGCIHRDVKLQNFVFDIDGNLKLIDFGLSSNVLHPPAGDVVAGTVSFMSPEMAHNALYRDSRVSVGCAADVWSTGIVLFSIFTQRNPYPPQSTRTSPEPVHFVHSLNRSKSQSSSALPSSQVENNVAHQTITTTTTTTTTTAAAAAKSANESNNNYNINLRIESDNNKVTKSRRQSRATSLKTNTQSSYSKNETLPSFAQTFAVSTSNERHTQKTSTPSTLRNEQLLKRVAHGQWRWPANCSISNALRDLVESFLVIDPEQRPSISTILRKPIWNLRRRTPPLVVKSFLGVQDDLLLLSHDEGQLMRMVKERNDNMTASRDLGQRHNTSHSVNNNTNDKNYNNNKNIMYSGTSINARTPLMKQSNEDQHKHEHEPVLLSMSSHTEQSLLSSKELSGQPTQWESLSSLHSSLSSRALSAPSPHNKTPFRGSLQVITRDDCEVGGVAAVQVYDIRHSARKRSKPIREITQVIAEETAKQVERERQQHKEKRKPRTRRVTSLKVNQTHSKVLPRSVARRAMSASKHRVVEANEEEVELLLLSYEEEKLQEMQQEELEQEEEESEEKRKDELQRQHEKFYNTVNNSSSANGNHDVNENKQHQSYDTENDIVTYGYDEIEVLNRLNVQNAAPLLNYSTTTPIRRNNEHSNNENIYVDNKVHDLLNSTHEVFDNNYKSINKESIKNDFATPVMTDCKEQQMLQQGDVIDVEDEEVVFATPFLPSYFPQRVNAPVEKSSTRVKEQNDTQQKEKSQVSRVDEIRTDVSMSLLDDEENEHKTNENDMKNRSEQLKHSELEEEKEEEELEEKYEYDAVQPMSALHTLSNTVRESSMHKRSVKSNKKSVSKADIRISEVTPIGINVNKPQKERNEFNKENVMVETSNKHSTIKRNDKVNDVNDVVDDKNNYEDDHSKNKTSENVAEINKQTTRKGNKYDTTKVNHNENNGDVNKMNVKSLNKWFDKGNGAVRTLGLSRPVRNRQTNDNMNYNSSHDNTNNDQMNQPISSFVKGAYLEHTKWNSFIHLEHEWLLASLRLTIVEDQARYAITWLAGEQYYSAAHPHLFKEYKRVMNKRYMDGFVCDMCDEEFLPIGNTLHVFHCACGRDLCRNCHDVYVKQCTCVCCHKVHPNSYALRAHLQMMEHGFHPSDHGNVMKSKNTICDESITNKENLNLQNSRQTIIKSHKGNVRRGRGYNSIEDVDVKHIESVNIVAPTNTSKKATKARKRERYSREGAANRTTKATTLTSVSENNKEPQPKLSIAAMHQKLVDVEEGSSSRATSRYKKRGKKERHDVNIISNNVQTNFNTNVQYSGFGPMSEDKSMEQKNTVIQAHLRFNQEAKALELAEKAIKSETFDKKITKVPEGPWRPLAKLQQMHITDKCLQPTADERESILNGDWIRHFYLYPRVSDVEPFAFVYYAQTGRTGAIYLTADFPLHSAISAMTERRFFAVEHVDTETEEDVTQCTSLVRAKAHPQWRHAFDTLQEIVMYDTNMMKQHQTPGTVSVYQAPRSAESYRNHPFLYVRWFRFSEDGTLVAFLLSNGAIQIFVRNEFELRWFDEGRKFIVRCNGMCEVIDEANFALADVVDRLLYGSIAEESTELEKTK